MTVTSAALLILTGWAFFAVCLALAFAAVRSHAKRRDAAEPEPVPVIDLDLLEAELSMEFHVWQRAA